MQYLFNYNYTFGILTCMEVLDVNTCISEIFKNS